MKMQLAAISGNELTGIITVFASMLAGFFTMTKIMLNQAVKDRDNDRKERKELSACISKMADASRAVASEIKVGNQQAEIRNGHLGEQNIKIIELIKDTKKDMLDAVSHTKLQIVETQTVNNEFIKKRRYDNDTSILTSPRK